MLSQHSARWRAASLGSNAGMSQMGSQTSTDGATVGRSSHKPRAEAGWLLADVLMWRCFSWCSLLSLSLANTSQKKTDVLSFALLLSCPRSGESLTLAPEQQQGWRAMQVALFGQQQVKVLFAEGWRTLTAQPLHRESPSMKTVSQVFSQFSGPHHALEDRTHSFTSV